MEHDFMWELMPMELGGLFTWKPNVAMNEVFMQKKHQKRIISYDMKYILYGPYNMIRSLCQNTFTVF